jgi:prevent-host-death family protein
MASQSPTTETMKISDVKQQLNSLVNRVYRREARILVEKAGIPVAAIVSVQDLQRLEQLDRQWEENTRAMEQFSAAFADVSADEAEAEVDRNIADIRRQHVLEEFGMIFRDVPEAELELEIARAISEVRAKSQANREQ